MSIQGDRTPDTPDTIVSRLYHDCITIVSEHVSARNVSEHVSDMYQLCIAAVSEHVSGLNVSEHVFSMYPACIRACIRACISSQRI